jgi:starvation-inducible outer membrane lipoprotein
MEKDIQNILGLMALTLVFTAGLSGCRANPKSLAKQTFDLYGQSIKAAANPLKLPGIAIKAASIVRKVKNLSAGDMQIYIKNFY